MHNDEFIIKQSNVYNTLECSVCYIPDLYIISYSIISSTVIIERHMKKNENNNLC